MADRWQTIHTILQVPWQTDDRQYTQYSKSQDRQMTDNTHNTPSPRADRWQTIHTILLVPGQTDERQYTQILQVPGQTYDRQERGINTTTLKAGTMVQSLRAVSPLLIQIWHQFTLQYHYSTHPQIHTPTHRKHIHTNNNTKYSISDNKHWSKRLILVWRAKQQQQK